MFYLVLLLTKKHAFHVKTIPTRALTEGVQQVFDGPVIEMGAYRKKCSVKSEITASVKPTSCC